MNCENSISICLSTVSVKHTVCSASILLIHTSERSNHLFAHPTRSHTRRYNTGTLSHTSYMIITFIYTNPQPQFQGRLNPQFKLQNNILTGYNNTCRPKQCRLRHSLDPNQYRKYAIPPTITPWSFTTCYNHQECRITQRTSPDQKNIQ